MKICIAGKNSIAVRSLKYLMHDLNIPKKDMFVCVNSSDLGEDTWQPSLKKVAELNNIVVCDVEFLYSIKNLFFFSLEFDRIIPPKKFKSKNLFNIHFSLLPSYKGMYTSYFPILNGEGCSGVTLHKIDEGIDTGDVIAQYRFQIGLNETCRDLYFKYLNFGYQLFVENVVKVLSGNFNCKPQNPVGSTYYGKDSVDFRNVEIDLNKTSFQIHNQIRALIFPEYQLPVIRGYRVLKSVFSGRKIDRNFFCIQDDKIILSGIDGFEIICKVIK